MLQFDVTEEAENHVRVRVRIKSASNAGFPGMSFEQVYAVFDIPFTDDASIENILHCYTFLYWLKMDPDVVAERIGRLEPVEMRLELKAGIQRSILINDAYSNDLSSLRIALQFASQHRRNRKMILILSDILQSGLQPQKLYREVAEIIAAFDVDQLIGIGTAIEHIRNHLPESTHFNVYSDTAAFFQQLPQYEWHDSLILLKGARVFQFERIARRLEQKAHKTVMEIDLGALTHNLQVYKRLLQKNTRMMVMVKAAGYGAGTAELARLLEFQKTDYLGVAYIDEGIELRLAGVKLPILVLNPEPSGYDALYRHELEPEVYNLSGLKSLMDFAGTEKKIRIHLKLDTGMHRLGFVEEDLPLVLSQLEVHQNLEVKSIFSHLSASDNPAHDAFTHQQAFIFQRMYSILVKGLGYHPLRHIANTGGIVRFPEYHFDMVRLGIGIYGVDSCGIQDQLQVVNTLKATISQIKVVDAGETVGYNRNGPLSEKARIATISIGYADGFLRLAGNGRYSVWVADKKAPTVGNICMDMSMIDVSDVPQASEGDEVIVFGKEIPVEDLARCLQTIPYEVFTNIAERVKRVYFQE
ncbi:MAG: alanine racemase [Lewinellaceae bacterium]|nr:alanine racemase [Lewinellaceae bacterium]